ncbi:DUF397 domain-containing protein [Streptomyces flavofungini]|uniref:DUF397 domain-containing protein n=1 Tax=Streptomyces flavofungini TaxID=68200 RepID=UPI0025B133AC|nr:DUF397 domain-containing protein [Streptomyces flavofungini]WJV48805.1 DUF397 domain-containing protein [Streptomyces flavofungini]
MREADLSNAQWRKSTYSSGDGGENCVEVAAGLPGVVPVRDSKADPDGGPVALIGAPAWSAFLNAICGGASTPR